ncbi:hypothetical protein K440DRAFT_641815 [Wilcoxina mikolae CBS 423.85]|nr:hypothetical protein K440DRAFT_641815 [Wilcoxina mikolae CBS 423.85]
MNAISAVESGRARDIVGAVDAVGVAAVMSVGVGDAEAIGVVEAVGAVMEAEVGAAEGAIGAAESGRAGEVMGAVDAVGAIRIARVIRAVGAIGLVEAVGAERMAKTGEVVDAGDGEITEAIGVRAKGAEGAEEAIVKCAQLKRMHAELGDSLPPEPFRKCMQEHLRPLILVHHSAFGDYSAGVIVGAEKRLEGFRLFKTSDFRMVTTSMAISESRTELLEMLTSIYEGSTVCMSKGV